MTNPTSNFGWQMPTNTDLVTDLPADFEVFGQAVDTSMADLKGGTTGQILSKASATDMDFTWIANDQGDITAVNVTSPITGGGSAGAVTVGIQSASTSQSGAVQLSDSTSTTSSVLAATPTAVKSAYDLASTANTAAGTAQTTANAAIPKSTVTTSGDVIYATGSSAVTRLGIGSTGQVLTVAAGVPSWATAAAGATIKSVRKSANQSVTSSTTVINDTHLKFAVAANETYIFQLFLWTYAADGTPDIKLTCTGPSGSTVSWSSSQVIFNAAGSTTLTVVSASGVTADLFVDANERGIQLYGTIANGANAGDLQLQWAQNTSSANSTTVKAGSYIFGIKV